MGFFESLFRGLGQGSTFGMSDEAVGALGALYAKTFAPELFQNQSISDLYKDARDQERNANALAKQQNPNVYGAAELVGGFALPAASFGGGLSGALKAGAGYGGLAGYGYSNEKSIPKQAKDIVIGSMLGAGLGAASYGAVKAAQNPEVQRLAKEFITDESGSLNLDLDYMMRHRPPTKEDGAPLYDVTGGGNFYPNDVYSNNGLHYYGSGDKISDTQSYNIIKKTRNNPDAEVTIYRAVPNNVENINSGDWVTLSKNYAKTHGESNIKSGYKILEKKVKAKNLFTNADSFNEFGYWE